MAKGSLINLSKLIPVTLVFLVLLSGSFACGGDGALPTTTPTLTPSPTATATASPAATPTLAPATPTPTTAVGEISIISATTEADFPSSLTFCLEAESPDAIDHIVLRYKVNKIGLVRLVTEVEPEFTSGDQVEASWTWDTRKASLPPGAELQYQWLVEDVQGREAQTSWASLIFHDSRYDWQILTEADVTLYWYSGSQYFGLQLMDAAQDALDKLAADTGSHLERRGKIYVYATSGELRDALIFPTGWEGGVAFTEYGIVAAGISSGDLDWGRRVVAHELAHLVIHQMTYNPYSDLPTWLDEGLAMYAEGDLRKDCESLLAKAISEDNLISVHSLCSSFPADPAQAGLSYGQSYSLVDFLIHTYGDEKMLELLGVFKEGSTCDNALQEVYSFDIDGLEERWRAYISAS